jgi:hypothetical protein
MTLPMDVSLVSKYMVRDRRPPSQSWRTFLRNHMEVTAAIDMCVVPTLTFERSTGRLRTPASAIRHGSGAHPRADRAKFASSIPPRLRLYGSDRALLQTDRIFGRDTYVKAFVSFGVDPPTFNTTTGKRERKRAFAVDNCEFEVAIKRCGIYQVPFHGGHRPPQADEPL